MPGEVTGGQINDHILDERQVAALADVAPAGGIPVLFRALVPHGTSTIELGVYHRIRVIDVWCVKVGGAGGFMDTVMVMNGPSAITNFMDLDVADGVIVPATTLDDATWEVEANSVRVAYAEATDVRCEVYVLGVRV